MGKNLYLECYAGISGDMTVAALLDLGANENVLKSALSSLQLNGYEIKISKVKKEGLEVCDFKVCLDERHENHDHDMDYLHSKENHVEQKKQVEHEHRGLKEICHIIENANLSRRAKEISIQIFSILAEAEAKVHGVDIEHVHFHEVGAIDSIIDIVAIAVCIDDLDITEVIVPQLYDGRGYVRCQHGLIPIPVPAVTEVAQKYGLIISPTDVEGELITPTGAAVIAALKTSDVLPKRYKVTKTGMGAGKRTYERPSILRAMLIEDCSVGQEVIYKLETNIDDATGEMLGYVMNRLLESGARDVNYMPIFMKKNRPAYQLNVLCTEDKIQELEQVIFEETTTIGIRRIEMERTVLKRESKWVRTSLGDVKVKVCQRANFCRTYPEYSSVVKLCEKHQLPFIEVYQKIQEEVKENEK